MSRKTVAFRQRIAQAKRAGRDIEVLRPHGAETQYRRGGWAIGSLGFKYVSPREFPHFPSRCCEPMKDEKWDRLRRLS